MPVIPGGPSFIPGHAYLTNLLACYLPGVYGGVPVSGTGPTLGNGSGGAGTVVTNVEGPALRSATLGSSRGLLATAPTAFKSWTNFTALWRGVLIANCDGYCPLVGMSSSDGSAQPYLILSVTTDAGGYTQLKGGYGDGGTFEDTTPTNVSGNYGVIADFAVTATVGGSVTCYVNGVSVSTGSLTTIATSGSTAQIIINQDINSQNRSSNAECNMACFWDRALSSTEILDLHNDPYQFLQGGPPTGTLAVTEAKDVAAFTGTIPIDYQYLGVGTVVETITTSHALSLTGIAARQAGDLLVACIGSRTTSTTSVTLPSGWTLVNEQKTNNALTTTGAIASGVMAYIVRGASDPALTFTHPAGISVARGTIVAYRPLNPVTLDTSSAATTATNTTSVNVTGLTTTTATELLVYQAVGGQEATWTNFDAATDPTTTSGTGSAQTADPIPGAWQERSDTNTTSGNDMSLAVADAVRATAGATGNFTATASLGAGHVIIVGAFKFTAVAVTGTLGTTEAPDTAAFAINPIIPATPIFVPGHALTTNMLACYLPGVLGGAPVQGIGPTLADGAGGAGTVVTTVEGPASRSNTLGAAKGLTATAPSAFKSWTNFTVLWRGLLIGTGDQFCPVVGVSIGDTDVSPYFMLNVSGDATSHAADKSFYGDATTSKTTASFDATSLYGKVVDFVATATVGGNVTFYANGVSIGTNTLATISTSSGTSKIVVNQGIDATSRSPNASVTMAAFWDRALSSTDVANLHSNPYGFLQSGVYGTLATTETPDIAALNGTLGSGISGTLATTEASDVAAFTGQLGVVGTLGTTEAPDVVAFTGTVAWNGVLTVTEAKDTAIINGLVAASGTLATTEALDTAALAGNVTWAGTLAATDQPDTAAMAGTAAWNGTLAVTEAKDTAAFNVTSTWLATLGVTEAKDVALLNGGIFGTGTLDVTEAPDIAAFNGSLAGAGVSGGLAATEAADIALINGTITGNAGTLAATEALDIAAINATTAWNGTLVATEAKDTAAITGVTAWNAVLTSTEAKDTALLNGTVRSELVLAATEAPDVAVITAFVAASGILVATEAKDAAAFTGAVALSGLAGILAATEARDTARIIGDLPTGINVPGAPGVLTFGRRVTISRW